MSHAVTRPPLVWAEPAPAEVNPEFLRDVARRSAALVLLLLAAPVIGVVALGIRILDGGPVFYRGARLGRDKQLFTIFKLRTLKLGAQGVLGSRLMSSSDDLLIPGGSILRASRLDELPQLLNVVRGEMRFLGPRPERPEVYLARCRKLVNYEQRFAVAPGLVGYSQLFTPHSTSKRFRAMLDNKMLKNPPSMTRELGLILLTVGCVAKTAAAGLRDRLWEWGCGVCGRRNRRATPRVQLPDSTVRLGEEQAELLDISEQAFRMRCHDPIGTESDKFLLHIKVNSRGRVSKHRVACVGEVSSMRSTQSSYEYIVRYRPASDSAQYTLHQHVLGLSLALPTGPVRQQSA